MLSRALPFTLCTIILLYLARCHDQCNSSSLANPILRTCTCSSESYLQEHGVYCRWLAGRSFDTGVYNVGQTASELRDICPRSAFVPNVVYSSANPTNV